MPTCRPPIVTGVPSGRNQVSPEYLSRLRTTRNCSAHRENPPSVFPTELNSNLLSGTERGREILLRTPMNRFGEPHEVVGAAVLLASDAASFITGQCIAVDGGFLASGVNS